MSQIYPVNVKCKHKFREKSWTKNFPTSKSYLLIEKNLEKAAWSTLIICCDWFCIKDLLLQMSWSQRGLSTKPEIFKTSLPRRRCGRRPQVRLLVPAFPRPVTTWRLFQFGWSQQQHEEQKVLVLHSVLAISRKKTEVIFVKVIDFDRTQMGGCVCRCRGKLLCQNWIELKLNWQRVLQLLLTVINWTTKPYKL